MSDERDAQMRAQFQERRRVWLRWHEAGMALLLGGVGLGALFEKLPLWISLLIAGTGMAILWFSPQLAGYRCPRCDNLMGRGDEPYDPTVCHECQFSFK